MVSAHFLKTKATKSTHTAFTARKWNESVTPVNTVGVRAIETPLRPSRTDSTVRGDQLLLASTELMNDPPARQDSTTTRIAA